MPSHQIRILHLSDLHFRGGRETEAWRRNLVLDSFVQDLRALKEEHPIDLVCVTGDVADWGHPDEYRAAAAFFHELLQTVALPAERLFLVPGNHDLNRRIATATWSRLRQRLARLDTLTISRWLAGISTLADLTAQDLDEVLERQTAYRDFLQALGRAELLPASSPHGRLGFRRSLRLPGRPFDVHLIGLDSAWLAGDDNDAGKLRLTEDQVMRLVSDDGRPLAGFRLALIHHPLTELADAAPCQRRLAQSVDLLLRGHLHDAEPSLWADPERRLWQLAAGCLYEGHYADQYPNGYTLLTVTLSDRGQPLSHDLRFRAYSSRGFWHDDASLYRTARDGRLHIGHRYPWPAETPTYLMAADAWEPRVGPTPAYTNEEQRRLSEALLAHQEELEQRSIDGQDTTALREAILALKRQLRDGPHLRAGDLLSDGRFRLVRELGQGGFGSVWQAYDRRRHEIVAVKVLHGQWSRDKSRQERFLRGANRMAELRHPHIVRVIEPQIHDERYQGFVMEYLSGGDLHHALLRRRIPAEQMLRIAHEIGGALAFAHQRGIVHRDVKPANILLDGAGRSYLTDFDLVWAADSTGGTRSGGMGTLLYTAPELLENARDPTPSADIYSLAMSALAALSGVPPSMEAVRNIEPFLLRLPIPEKAQQALGRALKWQPSERFSSITEFLAAFADGFNGSPGAAPLSQLAAMPFRYLGVRDAFDYQRLKMRGRQVDAGALAAALCTTTRMSSMMEAWRAHPGAPTLLVCNSEQHARTVRAFLGTQGINAGQLPSPPHPAPGSSDDSAQEEATILAALQDGRLDALCIAGFPAPLAAPVRFRRVFLLDFTMPPVLCLERLAASQPAAAEAPLLVLDLIGQHPLFHRRLEALLSLARPPRPLAAFLGSPEALRLPDGSSLQLAPGLGAELGHETKVAFEPALISIFRKQCGPAGARPTASQFFANGFTVPSSAQGTSGWFRFLDAAGALQPDERRLLQQADAWFREVETTPMTKSFKMVLIKVLLDSGALRAGMPLDDLGQRCLDVLRRDPELQRDIADVQQLEGMDYGQAESRWLRYWRDNPVKAWTTPRPRNQWFTLRGEVLVPALPFYEEEEATFCAMTRELVDYRLAQYRRRLRPEGRSFTCKLITNRRQVILKLPSRKQYPGLPLGTIQVRLPDRHTVWHFRLMKEFCNHACPADHQKNELDALMKSWFGQAAGHPGTVFTVHFIEQPDGWHLSK